MHTYQILTSIHLQNEDSNNAFIRDLKSMFLTLCYSKILGSEESCASVNLSYRRVYYVKRMQRISVLNKPFRASMREQSYASEQKIRPAHLGHRHTVTHVMGRRWHTRLLSDWTAIMRHCTRLHHPQLAPQFAASPTEDTLSLRSTGKKQLSRLSNCLTKISCHADH